MGRDHYPVIIGVGQETWRERDVSRTPVDALQAVATKAASDTGSERVLGAIDALVHVPTVLNQVPDLATAVPNNPGAALARRLGIEPLQFTADVGGNLPQQLVTEFAARLTRGEHQLVLLCGVELLASLIGALRAGEPFPDWGTGIEEGATQIGETPRMSAPTELAHGFFEPINVYPLFESALRHARGWTADQQRDRLGELISAMSKVAASNPYAWKQQAYSASEVLSTAGGNRMICEPYTKLMNAIINVDQAAAVILTTEGKARELGVPPERCIYFRGGAGANDPWHVSERESFHESPAIRISAAAALQQSGLPLDAMTHFDIYSCFPSAVQIACHEIGLPIDDPRGLTVTGGLTLFGGAGNNYSLHAIAQMVHCLRDTPGGAGLVSAVGGYLTKHAIGIYSSAAPNAPWQPGDPMGWQQQVDARSYPPLAEVGAGAYTVEAHTVAHKRGEPSHGILVGRLASGERCVAVAESPPAVEALLADDCVGAVGSVIHREGRNHVEL